ncbi:MAG: DUF5615 family PIN-like protein [Planctomycetes bacterium]|nr:DUF5615 family PIN-like protein [Planctomycetota bacterium]
MKILLDECIDRRFAAELPGHAVETVPAVGWAGKSNGELLSLAHDVFDVFITVDQNLVFQKNIVNFDIAVLVLHAPTNRLVDLIPLVKNILSSLSTVQSGQVSDIRV